MTSLRQSYQLCAQIARRHGKTYSTAAHFAAGWESAFRSLLRDGRMMPDPSVLVSVPSLTDPSLEPVPNLAVGKVDWSRERGATRERLAARLQRWGYPSVVVAESGPFRPSNVDRRVRGLVFVGTGTVPGVGVPMVLVSGRLAAERVDAL